MSKTTRALAILGVVAGLGVAALPLSSYAVDPTTITHGDTNLTDGTDYSTINGNKWVKDTATIQLEIEDELSITLDSSDAEDPTFVMLTGDVANGFATESPLKVTVVSNNSNGYNLNLAGSTDKTNKTSLYNETGEEIVKAAGTFATPAALDATSSSVWGYAIADNAAFDGDKYAGVTETGETIKQVLKTDTEALATLSDTGDITNINFAAAIKRGQAAGVYTGTITLTATNNAAAANN